MSLALINEIWKVLKPNIETGDISSAAETLVNYLVDEAYSPTEIKQTFRLDSDIKGALTYYLETPDWVVQHEEDEDEDFHDLYDDEEY
jgi:hypothetical protein